MTKLWDDLIETYAQASIEFPDLKKATLAQWALESGRGKSELATEHYNFAGLKYRKRMEGFASAVDYLAHDGEDTYCKFGSLEEFIVGYWHFIDSGPYHDWKEYGDNPLGYIRYIREIGYAEDDNYVYKISQLMNEVGPLLDAAMGTSSESAGADGAGSKTARVAIVVGHNSSSRGAYSSHLHNSEWIYNQTVAKHMHNASANLNLKCKTFLRTPGGGYKKEIARVYKKVNNWEPDLVVELHFNAGGGRGTETLYWHQSSKSRILAKCIQDELLDVLELKDRGLRGRKQGDRGWRSLVAANAPVVLTEPFFGDSGKDCKKMLQLGERALARAYLRGLRHAAHKLDI